MPKWHFYFCLICNFEVFLADCTVSMPIFPSSLPPSSWSLSEAQAGLWYAQQLAPENPSFNTGHVLWLRGPLDVRAFTQAANQVAQQAQALRLRFEVDALQGQVRQWLDERHVPLLEHIDCRSHADPQQTVRQHMQADMQRPLVPGRDRLARQCLFELGQDRYAWYQRAHHLLSDGYGMALWEGRVLALYAAALQAQGQDDRVSPNASWGDYNAVMQEDAAYRRGEGGKRARDAAYWHACFADMPEVAGMAANSSARAQAAGACVHQRHALAPAWRQALLAFAQKIDLPWPDVLSALTALYCLRMAGAEQTVVGIPFMGRLGSASARVPAMVMNVLPLRVRQDGPEHTAPATLALWLRHMARAHVQARRHGRYRSEQLRRDLGLLGGNRRLYGTLINVQPFYQPPRCRACRRSWRFWAQARLMTSSSVFVAMPPQRWSWKSRPTPSSTMPSA